MERRSAIIFLLGFLSCAVFLYVLFSLSVEFPFGSGLSVSERGKISPSDWISENKIVALKDRVIIYVNGAEITNYAPTGSMKPLLDERTNGIRIVPENEEAVGVGDLVSFRKEGLMIIHRIVEKGQDEAGTYFITQGDNTNVSDGKIRFSDIRYVTIGVIW